MGPVARRLLDRTRAAQGLRGQAAGDGFVALPRRFRLCGSDPALVAACHRQRGAVGSRRAVRRRRRTISCAASSPTPPTSESSWTGLWGGTRHTKLLGGRMCVVGAVAGQHPQAWSLAAHGAPPVLMTYFLSTPTGAKLTEKYCAIGRIPEYRSRTSFCPKTAEVRLP